MNWILLAILTAFFYGVYNFFIKVSADHINQAAGALILQIVAALIGGLVLVVLKITNTPIAISSKGITYAILAGVFVGLAEITSFFVFSRGAPASVGIPVIIGGSVIFGAALGLLVLKENFNPLYILGILFILVGVVILAR